MKFIKHTRRALLVLLACSLGIFYSANPYLTKLYPRQVTDNRCVNPTTGVSNLGAVNLIPNPTLNDVNPDKPRPMNWFPSAYGQNNPNFHYLTTGHAGNKSVEVDLYDYKSGAANWMFDNQPVIQDQQYYFSDFYKSNINSEIEASFTMPDGSLKYEILGFAGPSQNWTKFQTTFTVPLGAQTVTAYQYIQANGHLTTSDYSLRAYSPRGFNSPMLTLTFDDGYESTYSYGAPLMNKYNFKSTQFIITNLVGDKRYMTRRQLRSLIGYGHEIASHTVTHDSLAAKSDSELQFEVGGSKNTLKKATLNNITDFAYPLGVHDPKIERAVSQKYNAARGVEVGLNSKDNLNCYDLKAQDVHSDTTTEQIADWIRQAQGTNTWLILVYHSVEPDTSSSIGKSPYNVTPTQLEADLKVIKANGIDVKTMAEAINAINGQAIQRNSTQSPKPQINKQNLTRLKA